MKKLIYLFISILLVGCGTKSTCVLAQFPPQIVYAGAGCAAPLPNYVPKATVTGGCTGFVVTQMPSPGTVLNASNKTVNVILKATGSNGKSSQVSFIVTLADTITPRISGITAMQMQDSLLIKSKALYDLADRMTGQLDELFNKTFPFARNPGSVPVDDYGTKMLVMVSMKDSTGLGRQRFATYVDSINFPIHEYKTATIK